MKTTLTFATVPGESVLAAGLRHGVALPYACATGTCGTCRARLVEGDFDEGWAEAPGRQGLKAARRELLMCQGAPLSDCRLALLDPLGIRRRETALPSEHAIALTLKDTPMSVKPCSALRQDRGGHPET